MNTFNIFKDFSKEVIESALDGLNIIADDIVQDAKKKAPVKTGALRDSIHVQVDTVSNKQIGSYLNYAYIQHETNPNGKAFYLRNALLDNKDVMFVEFTKKVSNDIENIGS